MARKTTRAGRTGRASSRRKASAATAAAAPVLEASRLFMSQYPLAQLCGAWVQQLEKQLAGAGSGDAAAVATELALEREVLALVKGDSAPDDALLQEVRPGDRARREGDSHRPLKQPEAQEQLEALARQGSVLANYVRGCMLLQAVLPGAPENNPEDDEEARKDALQQVRAALTLAAERGFAPACSELSFVLDELGDRAAAELWFARALEAGDPPALLDDGRILLAPRPLPAKDMQARLDRLYDLALGHCWEALDLLCQVCKMRRENEVVRSFEQKTLRLVQDLARQGFVPAMLALGHYYDTILLAPDVVHRDRRVHHWYDMAAAQGSIQGLILSIRSGFFGPIYMGSAQKAAARVRAVQAPDEAAAAQLKGVLGRLLRPINLPDSCSGAARERAARESEELLLEAALAGNQHDLCRALRAEIVWDNEEEDKGYPGHTLLDDARLDQDPQVLFTRGQTLFNYQDSEEEFACARRDVLAAAAQGVPEAEGWLTDAVLRGLYGLRQNIAFGLRHLQEGLANGLPRAMALEALRLLGWIRGIPAEEQADRAWIRELLGMAASADDCLGFVALVLLEALEPASPQRQRAIAADLHKAILWAQTRADASALYLVGCVASLHLDDPGLNAVCRHYGALLSRKSGEPWCRSEYTAHLACTTFHAASLLGELSALKLTRLVHPDSGNLARLREQGTASLEDFM